MDVKSLLNEEDEPRPRLQRFGPFKPHQSSRSPGSVPQPQLEYRHRLPSLGDAPPPSLRSLSYSSSCSSSSNSVSTPSAANRTTSSDSLPPISSRVPTLVRSESGGSQSPHSPATPSGTPNSTPPQQYNHEPLRAAQSNNTKSVPFINLPLPRPQIVSTSSYTLSAAPSGPPSSLPSSMETYNNLGFADLTFPYATSQPQPTVLNPQASLSGSSEPPHNSISPPSSSSHTAGNPNNASSSSKTPQKKNSYPCPLAKQFSCTEYFTTSGHAARHAKKHTGKKDAICPECSKAFTRKDNMEQHRRTHTKDSANAARAASKSASDKDESRQRKLMKLQQHKKSRAPSIDSSSASAHVNTQLNSATPSSSSAIGASPTTTTSYPASSTGPVQMDGTLDPRLRESPSSVNSGSVSGFSPTPFTPAAFAIPDTNNQVYPQNFNTMFSPQAQMPLTQQMPAQVLQQQHSMNITTTNPLATTLSPSAESFPQRSLHRGSYSNQLDYRMQQSPTESPLSSIPDGLGLNMPMSMPASMPLDMNMNQGMSMMMDGNLGMSPMAAGMPQSPAIAAGGPGLDAASMPVMGVAPAFDRLSLDKLALAAEAARNNGN